MNIYQLNDLIGRLRDPNHPVHDMLDFYIERRSELLKTLSKGISEIIKQNLK